ncbi:MAG: DDE-type integrase/transposase/recombinase, partial [Acidovorax soli]|nr:DDE-type integrase/transposase/recombinase [Acidovorax soli]
MILDIFSRHVVGWLLAERESADLAEQLIADTVSRHDVQRGMLTLHADRGAAMRSKPVAALLVELDITKSHSRPHVSDDNPYSESQFKTMKYRPDFDPALISRTARSWKLQLYGESRCEIPNCPSGNTRMNSKSRRPGWPNRSE